MQTQHPPGSCACAKTHARAHTQARAHVGLGANSLPVTQSRMKHLAMSTMFQALASRTNSRINGSVPRPCGSRRAKSRRNMGSRTSARPCMRALPSGLTRSDPTTFLVALDPTSPIYVSLVWADLCVFCVTQRPVPRALSPRQNSAWHSDC